MPKVRTVLGDIEASELGFTMAHEHVIHCPRGLFAPDNEWALRDFNIQLQMVKDYKAIGGGTLVDAMCRDQDGRCPAYLKVISETIGAEISGSPAFISSPPPVSPSTIPATGSP